MKAGWINQIPLKNLLLALLLSILLFVTTWSLAIWASGDRLDCRLDETVSFCAYRAGPSGLSVQWGQGQRVTLWAWRGDDNWRLWPEE